jgi:prepilin peptidase CpaA
MRNYSTIQILAAALVLVAAVTDIRSRRIPNWLTLLGVLVGLSLNGVTYGLAGVRNSLGGMLLGFSAYLILYLLRAMGAGDVKLMAALGAIVGPENWVAVFIASAVAGGVLAIALMVWTGRVRETLFNTLLIVQELAHFRAPFKRNTHLDVKDPRALNMPHGVAIAAGTVACLALSVI